MICKILGLFANTLTTNDKYSVFTKDNLTQPIQMQLYKKQNIFSQFFFAFLKSTSNFEHFEKKDGPHSLCIFENTECKERG